MSKGNDSILYGLQYLLECQNERCRIIKEFNSRLLGNRSVLMNAIQQLNKLLEKQSQQSIKFIRLTQQYRTYFQKIKQISYKQQDFILQINNIKLAIKNHKNNLPKNTITRKFIQNDIYHNNIVTPLKLKSNTHSKYLKTQISHQINYNTQNNELKPLKTQNTERIYTKQLKPDKQTDSLVQGLNGFLQKTRDKMKSEKNLNYSPPSLQRNQKTMVLKKQKPNQFRITILPSLEKN